MIDPNQRREALNKAKQVLAKHLTDRYRSIEKLENYFLCQQYFDRPGFFENTEQDVPLIERAPYINYPIVQEAIDSHCAFVLGDDCQLKVTSHVGEDDETEETPEGEAVESDTSELDLNKEDSVTFDAAITSIAKQVGLDDVLAQMLIDGMSARTAVAILCAKHGKLSVETTRSKWCKPTFEPASTRLQSLVIEYPYLDEKWNAQMRKVEVKVLCYRRKIDGMRDVTYQPIELTDHSDYPKDEDWVEDKDQVYDHNLGFCPALWYPFCKPVTTVNDIDGRAIHEHSLDEIDALNLNLSQWFRATFYAGDPQMVEIGVDPNSTNMEQGRVAYVDRAESPEGSDSPAFFIGRPQSGKKARRKGVSSVWTYPDANSDIKMLTLPGDSMKAIQDKANDMTQRLKSALRFVDVDPTQMHGRSEMSGKAFAMLYRKQITYCKRVRRDFGRNCVIPLVSMLLRFVSTISGQGKALKVRGLDRMLPILQRFNYTEAQESAEGEQEAPSMEEQPVPHTDWIDPELSIIWPPFLDDSTDDQTKEVDLSLKAMQGGLITREKAIERVARVFGIKNPAIMAEMIEAKKKEEADADMQAAIAIRAAQPVTDDGEQE